MADALRELEPDGVDHVFEITGHPATIELGARLLKRGGEMTLVGLSPLGSKAQLNALDLFSGRSSYGAACTDRAGHTPATARSSS